MAMTPWLTSTDLINAVKRKINIPSVSISPGYSLYTDNELLEFLWEELYIALVPQVLTYHSEYFVQIEEQTLKPNQARYPIPDRAIGGRLRDLFYKDINGNLFEMTAINPDDKSYFQYTNSTNYSYRYYLEGNEIVLMANGIPSPSGSLQFAYYLRPNILVENSRAFIISNFFELITCVNASIVAGDTISIAIISPSNGLTTTYVLTAVAGAPSLNEFQIGGTSIITAANLANAIIALDISSITNASNNASDTVTMSFLNVQTTVTTSNDVGFIIDENFGLQSSSTVPTNIVQGSIADLLQTKSGHRTLALSKEVLSVGTNTMEFNVDDIPDTLVVGDYVCLENESIIPQIPTDLHIGLVERGCARILAALGDRVGQDVVEAKIKQVEQMQSPLLGARNDGDAKKVFNKRALIRLGKYNNYRRY